MGVNKLLVVKLLREELSQDEDFVAMFLNEARLAARLNHANVVQTYEVGVEGRHHFLAMDYLDGQPLHAVLRRASGARACRLDVRCASSPRRWRGFTTRTRCGDFDGTQLRRRPPRREPAERVRHVRRAGEGRRLRDREGGRRGGQDPERRVQGQARVRGARAGERAIPVDARADVFAVGVMLWEAIAGRRFAQGDSQSAMLSRRLSGTEPRIREVVPDVDAELADICDRAMAHRASDRFASAEDFRVALEGYLDAHEPARRSPRGGPVRGWALRPRSA